MGACGSSLTDEQKEAKKTNDKLEYELNQERRKRLADVKLLLLGPGESGKSTIFKQMKIISRSGGFTTDQLEPYRKVIFGNCITQMKVIVHAATKLGLNFKPENMARAKRLGSIPATGEFFTQEVAEDIAALWADENTRAVFEKRDESFQLNDSADYFFDNVLRFAQPDYFPSEQDVLRARNRTTGIDEATFDFSDDESYCMIDVGGQRSERRKWLHLFAGVTAVIFCVSLSEYDQKLREDESQNRTIESLMLFEEICNNDWFFKTPFILFLNKIDLFKEKIKKVDLRVTFPSYSGGANYDVASRYMRDVFIARNQSNEHVIYTHFTCAIDTENIVVVFNAVRATIMNDIIGELF